MLLDVIELYYGAPSECAEVTIYPYRRRYIMAKSEN